MCHHLEAGARVVMLLMSLEFQRLQTKNISRILFKALGERGKKKHKIFNTIKTETF